MSAAFTPEQEARLRQVIREEVVSFALMNSGIQPDQVGRWRGYLMADWDRFRISSSLRGQSDA